MRAACSSARDGEAEALVRTDSTGVTARCDYADLRYRYISIRTRGEEMNEGRISGYTELYVKMTCFWQLRRCRDQKKTLPYFGKKHYRSLSVLHIWHSLLWALYRSVFLLRGIVDAADNGVSAACQGPAVQGYLKLKQ